MKTLIENLEKGFVCNFGSKCSAEVEKNKTIRIFGQYGNHVNGPQIFDKTFKVGDWAEYDSYNFSYLGKITSISEKCVSIEMDGYKGQKTRLKLGSFVWRNWDFDKQAVDAKNAEASYHI